MDTNLPLIWNACGGHDMSHASIVSEKEIGFLVQLCVHMSFLTVLFLQIYTQIYEKKHLAGYDFHVGRKFGGHLQLSFLQAMDGVCQLYEQSLKV